METCEARINVTQSSSSGVSMRFRPGLVGQRVARFAVRLQEIRDPVKRASGGDTGAYGDYKKT